MEMDKRIVHLVDEASAARIAELEDTIRGRTSEAQSHADRANDLQKQADWQKRRITELEVVLSAYERDMDALMQENKKLTKRIDELESELNRLTAIVQEAMKILNRA
jgi:predicted nuclease with TOPRIM domain